MASTKDAHEGEVTRRLDLANLLSITIQPEILRRSGHIFLLSRPFESLRPRLVAKPVADKVCITSIDQDRNLLQKVGDKAVVRLHPVSVEEEIAVDVEVARVIPINLGSNSLADLTLVQVFSDVTHFAVAEVAFVLTLAANIVDVLASSLVRSEKGIVAVNRSRDADPRAFRVVARLNH